MSKKLMCFICVLLFGFYGYTQRQNCVAYTEKAKEEAINPAYKKLRAQLQNQVSTWMAENRASIYGDSIFIPVVVHVLWHTDRENISDAQVLSQIKVLNDDYNGTNADTVNTPAYYKPLRGKTNFYFKLAKQSPGGLPTNGINRKYTNTDTGFGLDGRINFTKFGGQDPWDTRYYVNIYVCRLASSTNTFAVTYFPGGSARREGIVCDYRFFGTAGVPKPPYNLGRTVTHEMGHYFNLDHTWGPTDLTSLPDCTDDDHVEDTPPQSMANWGCPQYPVFSCRKNISDAFMDYMDYTDDPCMNLFTKGQAERMVASYHIMTPYLKSSKALQEPVLAKYDAGIQQILMPLENAYTCGKKIHPRIVIRNYGTEVLNTVLITTSFNNGPGFTQKLHNLNIAPYTSDTIRLAAEDITANGSIVYAVSTGKPNGMEDGNNTNDKLAVTFNENTNAARSLPFTENFTSLKFPPQGWSVINPDGLFRWVPTAGSLLSGYALSIMMDNIEFPKRGELDELVTPPLSFTNIKRPVLIFDHAFALYKFGRAHSDSLKVLVSADCGHTWATVFYKGGRELSTATNGRYGYFSPDSASQWKRNAIDLSMYSNQPGVMISFQNISGKENILYLDNIAVKDNSVVALNMVPDGIVSAKKDCSNIGLSPNPVVANIVFTGANIQSVRCINTVGQTLWQGSTNSNNIRLPQQLQNGVYFMHVTTDNKTCVKKVVVQR